MYLLINYTLIKGTIFRMYSRTKKCLDTKQIDRQFKSNRIELWLTENKICLSFCYEGKIQICPFNLDYFLFVFGSCHWKEPLQRGTWTTILCLILVASHILKKTKQITVRDVAGPNTSPNLHSRSQNNCGDRAAFKFPRK